MRRLVRSLLAAGVIAAVTGGPGLPSQAGPPSGPSTGPSQFGRHLVTVAFDPLGEPSNGLNTEIVFDPRGFAYVGSLSFDPAEDDIAVKAVDVSDPANPVVTDAQMPTGGTVADGNFGPFDVKVAGNVLAASTQGFPESDPGVELMDITNPADPVPASLLDDTELSSPFGSHNSFLWEDPEDGKVWLFATGLDLTSLKIYDVTDPYNPVFKAEYNNEVGPFVHDNFVQETADGRVLEYQASGILGMEILDVTKVVRGGFMGDLTFADDVVAYNHYGVNPAHAAMVTRPNFSHYIEPTASGRVTWVGDETECGPNSIIHAFDTSAVPAPPAKVVLQEIGTIVDVPDTDLCPGLLHAHSDAGAFNSQSQPYRWTGHNFDVWGEGLLIRGDYGRGVTVWDISDPAAPKKVATNRGMNQLVGEENRNDPGREKFLDNSPWVWQAVYDGDLIYASNITEGIWILDLLGD